MRAAPDFQTDANAETWELWMMRHGHSLATQLGIVSLSSKVAMEDSPFIDFSIKTSISRGFPLRLITGIVYGNPQQTAELEPMHSDQSSPAAVESTNL